MDYEYFSGEYKARFFFLIGTKKEKEDGLFYIVIKK